MGKLKIVVITKWCHPEFGGTRIEQKTFSMSDGIKAEEYYNGQITECSRSGGCAHTYIEIIHVSLDITMEDSHE